MQTVKYGNLYKAIKQVERFYWKREETEQPWTQPVLSANGTIGGDSFACAASSEYSTGSGYAWKAFDNDNTGCWGGSTYGSSAVPQWLEWYNPSGLKITQITFTSGGRTNIGGFPPKYVTTGCVKDYTIQASADGNTWIDIYTGTNTSFSVKQSITASFINEVFYKYWRIYISSINDTRGGVCIWDTSITATQLQETITPGTAEDYDFYTDENVYKGVNI